MTNPTIAPDSTVTAYELGRAYAAVNPLSEGEDSAFSNALRFENLPSEGEKAFRAGFRSFDL